jgi:methyltransferase
VIAAAGALIVAAMLLEARVSFRHERNLRARGAIEPADDVWTVMSVVYIGAFLAMLGESMWRGGPPRELFMAGLVLWIAAKALKAWAIMSLGDRWSFRVLVLPGAPLVTAGPYRWLRHPNYVAVAGELAGAALMLAAPVSGIIFTLAFLEIMRRRINVEERALGIRST